MKEADGKSKHYHWSYLFRLKGSRKLCNTNRCSIKHKSLSTGSMFLSFHRFSLLFLLFLFGLIDCDASLSAFNSQH